jgi:peptidoglycan/LPS O-acetylase OafA/YrhL
VESAIETEAGSSWVDQVRAGTLALFLPGGTGSERLALLDTVRAFAVLCVVVHHTWFVAGSPAIPVQIGPKTFGLNYALQGAGLGVDIFFVLSGFLLSMPWHRAARDGKPRPSLTRYATRRFLRIVPPYWFMLMVMLLLMGNATIPWSAFGNSDGVKAVIAHIFFVQYLFPTTSGGFATVNGSVWTLTIEMLFYVTLPVLIYAFLGKRWRWGLPISIAFSLFWVWLSWHHLGALVNHLEGEVARFGVPTSEIRYFLSTQYLAFIGEFGIGICVAGWWLRRGSKEGERTGQTQLLIGTGTILALLVVLFFMYADGGHGTNELLRIVARMGVAAGVGLMIMGFLAGPALLRRPLEFLPFRLYGVIGYSVFLWHLPLLTIIGTWPIFATEGTARFWQLIAVGLPVTLVWGTVMYLLVERPFLVRRPGLLKRQPTAQIEEEVSEGTSSAPRIIQPEAW